MAELITLSDEECRRLLDGGVVGRIGYDAGAGPRIVPVNYAMDGEDVVVRTSLTGELARLATRPDPTVVAFEVDHIDHDRHQGWSVLASGDLAGVALEDVDRIRATWPPRPWADGPRPAYLRIAVTQVSGRQLGRDWSRDTRMPVRRTL